ncbi:hypothetical protein ACPYO6_07780 [Georgenia sp. Z1344]|uniref:hypothetical protein n=1 Tax=Georgenia sp. Z1344 TaxID=3416706 RepID=UPI003CEDF031
MPRTRPALVALVLTGAATLTACSGSGPGLSVQPIPSEAGPSWQAAAPQGSTVTTGAWTVTLGDTEQDATARPVAGVDLLAAPADDQRIVSVLVDATNDSTAPLTPADHLGLELVTTSGASYPGNACEGEATVADAPEVAPGESLSARWCTVIPADALEGAVWAVVDGSEGAGPSVGSGVSGGTGDDGTGDADDGGGTVGSGSGKEAAERRYVLVGDEAPAQLPPLPVTDTAAGRHIELPAASGTPIRVGDLAVAIGPSDLDPELLPDEDGEEPEPYPDEMFVGSTVAVTNLGTEPVQPALGGLELVDWAGGSLFAIGECDPASRPTDPLGPIQPGGTAEISLCQAAPIEAVAGARWQLTEGAVGWGASYRYVELGVDPTPELLAASTAPEPGNLEGIDSREPLPAGESHEVGYTSVTIDEARTEDELEVDGYSFTDEPEDGNAFVLADIAVTEDGSAGTDSSRRYEFDVEFVDAAGQLHDTRYSCSGGEGFEIDDLDRAGATPRGEAEGELCAEVDEDLVEGGAWRVTSYGPERSVPVRHVATATAATSLEPFEVPVVEAGAGTDPAAPAPAGTPVRAGLWVVSIDPVTVRDRAEDDEDPLSSSARRIDTNVTVTNTASVPASPFDDVSLVWIAEDGTERSYGDESAQCSWEYIDRVDSVPGGTITHDVCMEMTRGDAESGHWEVRTTGWSQDPDTEELVEEEIVRYVAAG